MTRSLVVLGVLGMLACGERSSRTQAQQTDSAAAPESSVAVASSTAIQPPLPSSTVPSPFPANQDTVKFQEQLAGGASQVPSCGAVPPRITGDSIGPFRPGAPLESLRRRCPRLLYGWVLISDGYNVPTVAARLGGATITAFASDTAATATLGQVEVRSRGATTAEGFGVGSTLRQLVRVYGAAQASESDCVLRVWFDTRPLIAFYMEYSARDRRECGALSAPPLSPNLIVKGVVITPR